MTIPEHLQAPTGLAEPDLFADGFPHAVFEQVRAHQPVCWSEWSGGPGFWAVTSYQDIEEVGKNPALFSSASENGGHRVFDEQAAGVAGTGEAGANPIGIPFISRDPPIHMQQRRPVMGSVAPKRLKFMGDEVRERIARLIDTTPRNEPFDVVDNLTAPVPIKTLADLLGMPAEREDQLVEWTNALIGEDDPEFRQSPEYMEKLMGDLMTYTSELRAERMNGEGDDIVTLLSHQLDGTEVSLPEFFANIILVLVGGNETTRNSLSGGLVALASNPEQWQLIRDDPETHIPGAVNEIVRWVSPVMHMRRTVTEDTEVGGVTMSRGDKVLLWYPSGNRDESVWPDRPFDFDITRPIVRHRGFGIGAHVCVGSRLAELQIRTFLEELAKRCKTLNLAGDVARIRSNFIDGIRTLPMQFEWE